MAETDNTKHPLLNTIFVALITTLALSLPYGCGFMSLFMLPFIALWLLYAAYSLWRHPTRRHLRGYEGALWLAGIAIVTATHLYWRYSAERYANEVSQAVEQYITQNGSCPPKLDIIHHSLAEWQSHLGHAAFYHCEYGQPSLYYGSTFVGFDREIYDFKTHSWWYKPD